MSEDVFNETKTAKLAQIAHITAVDKDVQKNVTKDEYYTILDENDVVRAKFGKISKGVFGMKIFDSTGEVVYEASDSAMTFRNVLPYNFDDSLDASYPLECEFYMPSNVSRINSCWVHIVGRNFRAYSTGAASGGGQTSGSGGGQTTSSGGGQTTSSGGGQTSSSGGSHSHTVSGQTAASGGGHEHGIQLSTAHTLNNPSPDVVGVSGETSGHLHASGTYTTAEHYHDYLLSPNSVTSAGAHTHSVTGTTSSSDGSHTHTVANHTHTVSNHTHTVSDHTHSVAAHTHAMVFGIYEDTDITGTNVYVDNGSGYGASVANDDTPVLIDVNIASSLTTTEGWKKIKITSSRLGRVVLVAILDITLSNV